MEDTKENDDFDYMTNEEYREKLSGIFENINENYKLRWFYNFIVAKLEGSK